MCHWVGCQAVVELLLMLPLPFGVGTVQDQPGSAYGGTVTRALSTKWEALQCSQVGENCLGWWLPPHFAYQSTLHPFCHSQWGDARICSQEAKSWISWGSSHFLLKVLLQNVRRRHANSLIAAAKKNRMQQIQHQMQQLFSNTSTAITEHRKIMTSSLQKKKIYFQLVLMFELKSTSWNVLYRFLHSRVNILSLL